jgi:hypothetical protein
MPEHYSFNERDCALLTAAAALLKKVANAETLRPAELVSVAKLQHVLSILPRATHELEVTVSVVGPRRKFGEIETWHYWEIAIEQEQLSISSGGHLDQRSTGGDSFTTMSWTAVPEEPAAFADYRGTLWMVPDVQSFSEAVAAIEFASGAYRIEITDSDNSLLDEDEDADENAYEAGPSSENLSQEANDEESDAVVPNREPWQGTPLDAAVGTDGAQRQPRPDLVSAAMTAQGGQIPLEDDSTFRLRPNAGDYLLWIRCEDPLCNPELAIADFWEFHEGDRLLITNREEDYPATLEQLEDGGPSLWKVLPGDRLAWVGWRPHSNEHTPTLIALINCLGEGYVYGEPASPTIDSVMSFGAPTSEPTPEIRRLWAVGYDAAVALGLLRTWQPPE